MILHDIRCNACGLEELDVVVIKGRLGSCRNDACRSSDRSWIPRSFASPEWGQSRHVKSLGVDFDSRSQLKSYLKANGLQEAGDPVGGSRTMNAPTSLRTVQGRAQNKPTPEQQRSNG